MVLEEVVPDVVPGPDSAQNTRCIAAEELEMVPPIFEEGRVVVPGPIYQGLQVGRPVDGSGESHPACGGLDLEHNALLLLGIPARSGSVVDHADRRRYAVAGEVVLITGEEGAAGAGEEVEFEFGSAVTGGEGVR